MQIDQRRMTFGPHSLTSSAAAPGAAPYMIAGRHMYLLGLGSGEIGPIGAEHLTGLMGGLWVHPYRIGDGVTTQICGAGGDPLPTSDALFEERIAAVEWRWRCGDLEVARVDAVAANTPAWASRITIQNTGADAHAGSIVVTAHLAFHGAWFSAIDTGDTLVQEEGNRIVATAAARPAVGLAFGASAAPQQLQIARHDTGVTATLRYSFWLAPGETLTLPLLLTVSLRAGYGEALTRWDQIYPEIDQLFAAQAAAFAECYSGAPSLDSSDADLSRDFALARANLRLLTAEYPDIGAYLLAGLPEYPQLFGCDTAYSIPGAVAAGFVEPARGALETLAQYAARACGRIPHEITTNGRVFHPGNIQETPQFTIALWDYLRWTGDTATARRLFPICREGMDEMLPAMSGGGLYPYGDGMVERLGMGSRKLDSACYAYAALDALARLAAALGEPDADDRARADTLRAAFERDWWMEEEGLYGDSMHSDGSLRLDGHWTVALPAQLGLASPERAARMLDRIEQEWVNEWGLVHTRTHEELVWTLPTGLLALAAFANDRRALGLRLTRSIACTAQYGALGAFKELIPEGLCFVQLWSAALYVQAIIEGLLGISPLAHEHRVAIAPRMPHDAPPIALRGLQIGAHRLDIDMSTTRVDLRHTAGPQPLTIDFAGAQHQVEPGGELILKV
jgi:hypothetical protein